MLTGCQGTVAREWRGERRVEFPVRGRPAIYLDLLATLVPLALIDSTNFGTLLIPLWLMLTPGRPRPGMILLFLGTVAAFYLLLGMALGIVMEPWTKAGKERRAARRAERLAGSGPSLHMRMRARATDPSAPVGAMIVLAFTAAVIEAASMIPYLAAIGVLTAAETSQSGRGAVLCGYCLVMIAPALLLLAARILLHDHVAPFLAKLEALLSRNANEALAWVVFLVGLYIAGDGWNALGWY